MLAKRLVALLAALMLVVPALPANAQVSAERAQVEVLAQFYAQYYGVPLDLVRRVINRESTFNPAARNGPYYGLMQILPATARTMGFRGQPTDLLDAETNLIYAVKYLRGAWLLANGSHDRAIQLYAKGYYYEAKAAGLLEETGLRPGSATPVAPTPPASQAPVIVAAAPSPAPVAPAESSEIIEVAAIEAEDTLDISPLGFLPPARPLDLVVDGEEPVSEALTAIAAAQTAAPPAPARPAFDADEPQVTVLAMAETQEPAAASRRVAAAGDPVTLRPSVDLVSNTFALLDSLATNPQ